jgi:L-alanine-DL-glutamate epimerase-like enolase superfamily enzyme
MKVESVDAFYLRMPEVRDIGDGSQDALLIRVRAGGFTGWGECEASPLPTIAALVAPISHSACKPVLDSVLGANLDGPADIGAIHRRVKESSLDLLQADHALSGIDIALWDLVGKRQGTPVWSFFGSENHSRVAYASSLFGEDPADTYERARSIRNGLFRAAKFGWGPIGRGSLAEDIAHVGAAREGLGPDQVLLVDTGCIFGHDVPRALALAPVLEDNHVWWWEEPFATGALREYAELAAKTRIPLAGGEGCHSADQARHVIEYGRVSFIQIDTGRIGGISAAREVAEYAKERGVQYVNHTFTSPLALSASLQPYADDPNSLFAEVPYSPSELALLIGQELPINDEGQVTAPPGPGLGMNIETSPLSPYLQEVEIRVDGRVLWESRGFEA